MRYRVNDLPVRGLGAFTPLATTNPIASCYGTVVRYGTLGVVPIPSPKPAAVPGISADPRTQPSHCSPDVFFPSEYVTTPQNMGPAQHFGMALRRLAPLPIPAVRINYAAQSAFSSRKIGGRAQVANPRAFQRFPQRTKAVS